MVQHQLLDGGCCGEIIKSGGAAFANWSFKNDSRNRIMIPFRFYNQKSSVSRFLRILRLKKIIVKGIFIKFNRKIISGAIEEGNLIELNILWAAAEPLVLVRM